KFPPVLLMNLLALIVSMAISHCKSISCCATKVLADTARRNVQTYTRRRAVSTGSGGVSTASRMTSTAEESVSTAGASMRASNAGMVDKRLQAEERDKYSEVDQAKMLVDLINQRKR
nr:hypothetical protein [Tanacetum cinerariifolium]